MTDVPATEDSAENLPGVPRPDEVLVDAVRIEAVAGDESSVSFIYELLRTGEDVNQSTLAGFTPLAVATVTGDASLASLLLEKEADPALASRDGDLPLHHAVRTGNSLTSQLLIPATRAAGALDARNATGWTPLLLAADCGFPKVLRALLRAKASIERRHPAGSLAAIHFAARAGSPVVLEVLLDYDAEIDAVDAVGRSALHLAAAIASPDCVLPLLTGRADPCRRTSAECGGGTAALPLDLVPQSHADSERVCRLLSTYARPAPAPRRTDAQFHIRDGEYDVLF